ncbi:MAG: c-type cytochrome biogenesis protein CcsB [Candidatus Methylomirabilales bacterium]
MDVTFFFGALALYIVGTVAYVLLLSIKGARLSRLATAATVGGFMLHTMALLLRLIAVGQPPPRSTYEALSVFAWATVLVYLGLEFRFQRKVMGAFVLPIVVLITAAAATLSKGPTGFDPALTSTWVWMHVILILLGNAALALTCGVGLMYILQERQLKSKSLGAIYHRLPSLEFLDVLSHRTLLVGFPLLTAGLVTGALQAQAAWGRLLTWDPTQVLSLITWVMYAGLLQARLTAGWRGRKAALLAVVGFCALLVAFVGVSVLAGHPHAGN